MAGIELKRPRWIRGFTLIEMSVVLVIIGILLAAVLQGREMIATARYKSLMSDVGRYHEAFNTFRDRYNALPGDYAQANSRLGLSGANGNGNGLIDIQNGAGCDTADEESCRAWQHLRAARLLKGDDGVSDTSARPEHAFQEFVSGFFSGTNGNGEFGHKLLIEGVPAGFAIRMDDELDDGDAGTGRVSNLGSNNWPAVDSGDVNVVYGL